MRLFLVFLLMPLTCSLHAQRTVCALHLVDSMQEPLAYCYAVNTANGEVMITDEHGEGYLSVQVGDTLTFSHIAYNSIKPMVVAEAKAKITITLTGKIHSLSEAKVRPYPVENIVKKALDKIPHHVDVQRNLWGFYRQIHKEQDKAVRLIDAQVGVSRNRNHSDRFCILALRRSFVYESNGEKHGDHLVDLFLADPFRYPTQGALNPKAFHQITWRATKPKSDTLNVSFSYIDKDKIRLGKIRINLIDTTCYAYYEVSQPKVQTRENWSFQAGERHFVYKRDSIPEKYSLHRAWLTYQHDLYTAKIRTSRVTESFRFKQEAWVGTTPCSSFKPFGNLYSKSYTYQPKQWLGAGRIDATTIRDLEENHPTLEQQFEQAGQ